MLTSELALRADVNAQTLRYYERRGLLPRPRRTSSGYRDYPETAVQRIRFVKRAQELGFTLAEVRQLLRLQTVHSARRGTVRQLARSKIKQIEEKLRDLGAMRDVLTDLVSRCETSGDEQHCPILDALASESEELPRS